MSDNMLVLALCEILIHFFDRDGIGQFLAKRWDWAILSEERSQEYLRTRPTMEDQNVKEQLNTPPSI